MESQTIIQLSKLEPHYAEQITALLVDSFYSMFKGISKNRDILCKLFMACIQLDLFYVFLHNKQLAGFIAISDFNKRAVMIRKDVCISIFGPVKGTILTRQLQNILSVPAVSGQGQGYIDFIATAPDFKRCGVATGLLVHAEQNSGCQRLYLDVLTSNHSAINLYEKLGYDVEASKKNIWMRLAGVKAMNIMKKDLK